MIGIIGGTGLNQLQGVTITEQRWVDTPFGEPSSILTFGEISGQKIVFLARHGNPHKIAPHLINYRANISALQQAGVKQIIAVNAVGGIHSELAPTVLAFPDQIIDYTHSRAATIFDGCHIETVEHVDFSYPYTPNLRDQLVSAAKLVNAKFLGNGTYAATQGPRLETAAEIKRLKQDGCDMVGMTGMPEAIIARELGLEYACIALSVNWAAGLTNETITMEEIHQTVEKGMTQVFEVLSAFFKQLK